LQMSVDTLSTAMHQHDMVIVLNKVGKRLKERGVLRGFIQQRASQFNNNWLVSYWFWLCVRAHGRLQEATPTEWAGSNPMVWAYPIRIFMHCMAWPAAPLTKLSMDDAMTK